MALFQISEPGQSPSPHARKIAVGIDLGTTNSLVAAIQNNQADTLADEEGRVLLPSVVRYTSSGKIVGQAAKNAAVSDPLNTLVSIKRLMGRGNQEVQETEKQFPYPFAETTSTVPHIQTAAGLKTPVEVSADILIELADRGRATLGSELEGVVITVPAYFDDAQRQATKDAARLADLNLLRLLNEPTAAAVAYGLDQQEDGIIAVYDLGGGTFDISVLRLTQGVFEVMATGGDSALGGDDFDRAIMIWMCEQLKLTEPVSPQQERSLLNLACNLKEQLTEKVTASVDHGQTLVELNREQFNRLVDPLIDKTLISCKRCLRDAGINKAEINHVIMVGGSTRSPRVREKVADLFGQKLLTSIDPDKVVAIGAALQADVLVGNKPDNELLLLDVVPLSLGLETMGGLVEKIIPRNTTIPVAKTQEFTTFKDGQTAMSIHAVQGERELVADNRSLARFELRNIPPMVAGAAHIAVTFQVDADGLLSITARETSTGVSAEVSVKPSYGLSDDEITNMLKDAYKYAEGDISARTLREQQVEASRLIEALTAALEEDGHRLLTNADFDQLTQAIKTLERVRDGNDAEMIRQQIEQVSKLSDHFAEKRMDSNIKAALTGHHLKEFNDASPKPLK